MPSRTDISLVVEKGRPFGQIKSVDDVQPPAEYSFFLTVMVCVTAVTGFLMGYDLCIVAVVLGPIREYFGVCGSNYVDSAVGSDPCIMNELFVAILAPGAMVSSLIGGWAADKFGRRALLIASDIFFASAATLMAVSTSYWSMLLGRSLLGVGIGMGFVVFPAYMAEVSPAEVRGALVTCQEVAQCIGCLSAYGIAFIVSPADHWRGLLLAAGIPAILQLFGTLILPESPRWLVANNKLKQARIALEKISGYQPFCGTNKFDDPHNELISNFVETILCREIELPDEPTKLDRVRASKLVLAQAEMEESIKKFNDLEELDCEVRSVALTLASRSASRTSIGDTDFLAETEFPPAMPQPPLQILLDLMEEQEVRENGKEKRREDQRIRYEEELVSAKAEGHLGLIKYSFLRVKSVCTLRGRLSRLLDHKYALLVACGCAAAQNLTGANTILYYSVDLFKMGGICNPLFAGVMIGVVKVSHHQDAACIFWLVLWCLSNAGLSREDWTSFTTDGWNRGHHVMPFGFSSEIFLCKHIYFPGNF